MIPVPTGSGIFLYSGRRCSPSSSEVKTQLAPAGAHCRLARDGHSLDSRVRPSSLCSGTPGLVIQPPQLWQAAMISAAPLAPCRMCAAWPQAWSAPALKPRCSGKHSASKASWTDSRRRREALAVQGRRGLGSLAENLRRGANERPLLARAGERQPDETGRDNPAARQHQEPASPSSSSGQEESSGTEGGGPAHSASASDPAPGQEGGAGHGPPDSGSPPSTQPAAQGTPTAQFQSFQVRDLLMPEKVDASDVKLFREKLCGYSSFFVTGEPALAPRSARGLLAMSGALFLETAWVSPSLGVPWPLPGPFLALALCLGNNLQLPLGPLLGLFGPTHCASCVPRCRGGAVWGGGRGGAAPGQHAGREGGCVRATA